MGKLTWILSRAARLAATCFVLSTGLLAQSPAPSASPAGPADPLAEALEKFSGEIQAQLGPLYDMYERAGRAPDGSPIVAPPEDLLRRIADLGALGGLPTPWLKKLNEQAEGEQGRGLLDKDRSDVPDEYKDFELQHAAVEPWGTPVRGIEDLQAGRVPIPSKGGKKPTAADQLKKMAALAPRRSDPKVDEEWNTRARNSEVLFKDEVRAKQIKALERLKKDFAPLMAKVAKTIPGDSKTPWTFLKSPGIDLRVRHYLAERYYKGRWAANKGSGASQGTGDGATATEGSGKGTPSLGDTPGATGTGQGKKGQTGGAGTGTGHGGDLPKPGASAPKTTAKQGTGVK